MIISESRIEEIISDTVKRTLERYHSADESPTSDTDTYAAAASIVVGPLEKLLPRSGLMIDRRDLLFE
jgi:hypothetical protein